MKKFLIHLLTGLGIGFVNSSYSQDTIHYPWSIIELTGEQMKFHDIFLIPVKIKYFPWFPIVGGATGAGALSYFLLKNEDKSEACAFTATPLITPSSCNQANGAVTINVNSPGEYSFSWSNGSNQSVVQNVVAGSYTATITRTGTTCTQLLPVTIGNQNSTFNIQVTTNPADCGVQNGTASANVNPSGNYSYSWSNGTSGQTISNLATGNYQLTVSLGSTCTQTTSFTVNALPPQFDAKFTTTPANCGIPDGTASIIMNPPDGYNFNWSNGNTGEMVEALEKGNYTVTVSKSGTSCNREFNVNIDELPFNPNINSTTTPANCKTANGTASLSGESIETYTIHWSDGSTGPSITGLQAGEYSFTVTIPNSQCVISNMLEIEELPPDFSGTTSHKPADCGISNGEANILMSPPGNYTYLWSNGDTTEQTSGLGAGTYSIDILNDKGCKVESMVTIPENPAKYITSIQPKGGNCIGENADILITTQSPTSSPLHLTANGPENSYTIEVPPGPSSLSSYFKILPGKWQITIRDSTLKSSCFEVIETEVKDSSDFIAQVDSLATMINQTVSGNVLNNDSGTGLKVISNTNPTAGTVNMQLNGNFTFTPPKDMAGIFTFQYTGQDTCQQQLSRNVVIRVDSFKCNFTVMFTATPAHCGLADGILNVKVNEAGTYSYLWNTGASGSVLNKVNAGFYTVTIEDVNKKCSLSFSGQVTDLPADYIRNLSVGQPKCLENGIINFEVISPGNGPIKMTVNHPKGINTFTISKGIISLSAFIDIPNGNYSITVFDESAGTACLETIQVKIMGTSGISIMLDAAIPPSGPSANDGSIRIRTIQQGKLPYIIYLNSIPTFFATSHNFILGDMGVGNYRIQIQDQNGCISNSINVTLEFNMGTTSFNLGFSSPFLRHQLPEKIHLNHSPAYGYPSIFLSADYVLWRCDFESILSLVLVESITVPQIAQFINLKLKSSSCFDFKLQAGLSALDLPGTGIKPFWNLQTQTSTSLGKYLTISVQAGLQGWASLLPFQFRLNVKVPILSNPGIKKTVIFSGDSINTAPTRLE